jgi:phosphatidylserine/phosphatidylglycerophosphate/cardiolipin synthase-like enzyme
VKWKFASCGVVFLALASCQPRSSIPQGIQVFFSPNGGATQAAVNALGQATNSVLVQAYSFTSPALAQAMVAAQRRGVAVHIILDRSQRTEKYSEADFFNHNEVSTLIDARHAIAHNKVMIIDGFLVLTGSFNFTKAAEDKNAENLLIINDTILAKAYADNWHAHEEHSEPYARNGAKVPSDAEKVQ